MLARSSLLCLGRHTLTGLLSTCGQQFSDWSAAYRLFERGRFEPQDLFDTALRTGTGLCNAHTPVVAALDDTLLPKRGRKVAGTGWRRDPLGPPFQANLIWSQRFIQCSLLVPQSGTLSPGPARAIPVTFHHAPSARKPSRNASQSTWEQYKDDQRTLCLSQQGVEQLRALRTRLDTCAEGQDRQLLVCVDGSYTNKTVLKHIPERTTVIGRIRKDCKLYALPEAQEHGRGRRRSYGKRLPTPEELLKDQSVPWHSVKAYAAGKLYSFDIKSLSPVRWRAAGEDRNLRVVVMRPVAYRTRKDEKRLYRRPAYLICTDPTLDEQQLVQAYLWRWEIEVNFRDQKTVLGVGQAQMRTEASATAMPQFQVATYGLVLLAHRIVGANIQELPLPLWRKGNMQQRRRASLQDLIRILRTEQWGKAMGLENYSGFVQHLGNDMKPEKITNHLLGAICYAM